jgi:hypothetical protein
MKYALDRPTLLSLWHVQAGTYLTQIDVVGIRKNWFFAFQEAKMSLR